MPDKRTVAQFSVSPDALWGLKQEAANERKTLAEYLRSAVQFYIDSKGSKLDLSEGLDTWGGNRSKDEDEE